MLYFLIKFNFFSFEVLQFLFYVPIVELRHTTVMISQNWEQNEPDLKPRCPLSGYMVVESDNWGVRDSLSQLQKAFQENLSVDSLYT